MSNLSVFGDFCFVIIDRFVFFKLSNIYRQARAPGPQVDPVCQLGCLPDHVDEQVRGGRTNDKSC